MTVAEARDAGRMTAEHEIRALLAERYAAAVDDATRRGDDPAMLRAGERLLELLDTLPVRAPGGGGAGDSGGERGKLLSILDGPPSVGDASDA